MCCALVCTLGVVYTSQQIHAELTAIRIWCVVRRTIKKKTARKTIRVAPLDCKENILNVVNKFENHR